MNQKTDQSKKTAADVQVMVRATADYEQRAGEMTAAAREEIIRQLHDKFAEFRQLAKTTEYTAVRGVNCAREMGAQIELFIGHEKLGTGDFNALAPAIPDATLDFAKSCLAAHKKFPAAVTDYKVAEPEWKTLLVQLELLPKGQRGAAHGHQTEEPVREFLGTVCKFAQDAKSLVKTTPIIEWPEHYRVTFLREAEPIVEMYQQAKAAATVARSGH